jgi:hypothetical protein
MRVSNARLLAVLAVGFFGDPAGAGQEATDMKLEDAGFIMRRADTAEKLMHLRIVPPRKFIARTKAGKRYFIYADPDACKCVFLGDELAMKTYRDMVSPPPQVPTVIAPSTGPTPESEMTQAMDSDSSNMIGDGNILDYKF